MKIHYKDGLYLINGKRIELGRFKSINNKLIPQLWWGCVDNPNIVILAKNPCLSISDLYENSNNAIKTILVENLIRKNNDNKIVDTLFSRESIISTTTTANWWHQAFKEFQNENDGFVNDFLSKNRIAIFNLFGYYSHSFPYSVDEIKSVMNKDYVDYITGKVKNAKCVIVIWGEKHWKALNVIDDNDIHLTNKPRCKYISKEEFEKKFGVIILNC